VNFPLDLLEQADHLVQREKKKPRQASLRRSTSTAYYALFHLLCSEAAVVIAPNLSEAARSSVQRLIHHGTLKLVCERFLQTPTSGPLALLIGTPVSDDLRMVALTLLQVQEARHSADYDLNSNWNRVRSSQYIQSAHDAFTAWGRVRKAPEANVFLLNLYLPKLLDAPR
jgi:hypothetical protein